MLARKTVSVKNIHPRATDDDIKSHFETLLEGGNPVVGPMVPYMKKKEVKGRIRLVRRVATTVTFQSDYSREFKLHGSVLVPRCTMQGEKAQTDIAVQKEFLGLSPLQQHDKHQFDFLFVHGLGGHAFKSWTSGIDSAGKMTMWPRDLLPQSLREKGYRGRYSTVGYKASGLRESASALTIINSAAEDLLAILRDGMLPWHDHQPMYFACHSLGGLVLCQALNLALEKGKDFRIKPEHKNIFMRDGQCNVKGIVFFGTPFQWSGQTDDTSYARLGEMLGGDASLINSLKSKPKALATIIQKFKKLRTKHDIDILIYESQPYYQPQHEPLLHFGGTSPESANGSFDDRFKPIALDANHLDMIKFTDERDGNYKQVSEDISNLLKEASFAESYPSPPASSQSSSSGEEDGSDHDDIQDNETDIDTDIPRNFGHQDSSDNTNQEDKPGRRGLHWSFSWRSTTSLPQDDASSTQGERRSSLWRSTPSTPRDDASSTQGERRAVSGPVNNSLLSLRRFNTVFILDDSGSMRKSTVTEPTGRSMTRWKSLIDCMREICDAAVQSSDDGINLHFLINRHKDRMNVRNAHQVWETLAGIKIKPSGPSPVDNVLWMVLNDYLEKCRNYVHKKGAAGTFLKSSIQAPKPLSVIVITDGDSDEHEKVEATIIRTARVLPRLKIPDFQIGVQFVQIGDDERVTRWLKLLDDKIRTLYGIRDICDTRMHEVYDAFDAPASHDLDLFEELVVKRIKYIREILFGSMIPEFQGFRKAEYWRSDGQEMQGSERHDSLATDSILLASVKAE